MISTAGLLPRICRARERARVRHADPWITRSSPDLGIDDPAEPGLADEYGRVRTLGARPRPGAGGPDVGAGVRPGGAPLVVGVH
jgi:hypothetical protein